MLLPQLGEMAASHPSDPVEMRRMNFQTPALLNHQPIPVADLAAQIEHLKSSDGMPFSQVRILWMFWVLLCGMCVKAFNYHII